MNIMQSRIPEQSFQVFYRNFHYSDKQKIPQLTAAIFLVVTAHVQLHKLNAADVGGFRQIYVYRRLLHSTFVPVWTLKYLNLNNPPQDVLNYLLPHVNK
jgi:hypothetical protein